MCFLLAMQERVARQSFCSLRCQNGAVPEVTGEIAAGPTRRGDLFLTLWRKPRQAAVQPLIKSASACGVHGEQITGHSVTGVHEHRIRNFCIVPEDLQDDVTQADGTASTAAVARITVGRFLKVRRAVVCHPQSPEISGARGSSPRRLHHLTPGVVGWELREQLSFPTKGS
jgi:hypothetical protein